MNEREGPESRARVWFWRVWTALGIGLLVVGFVYLFANPLKLVLPPLALAGVLIYLLNPIVTWLERIGLPRALGTPLTFLVMIGVVVGAGTLVLPLLGRQILDFLERLPDIAESLESVTNAQLARMGINGRIALDPGSLDIQESLRDVFGGDQAQLAGILRGAGSVLIALFHGVVTIIVAPFIAFYIVVDLPRLADGIRRLVPPDSRGELVDVVERIGRTVGAYFRGQLMVATFVGVATAIGLAIIGLPFWAVVGLIAGVFNLVPFIGPFVGGVIGALIALVVGGGFGQAVAVVVVMTLVQQIDNHIITPNVLSRTVHVHPVTIILALAVAGSMFGILGMLVAIPTVAAAKLVLLYVLVTRVPSMRHLAGEDPDFLDGFPVDGPRDRSLVGLGQELRATWERRRRRTHEDVEHDPRLETGQTPIGDQSPR